MLIAAIIVALVWIIFGQTVRHEFVNYDDKTYVYGNPLVSAGLTWSALGRAFTDTQTRNWHPLTLVSHMIDCQLFDLKPGGHHFMNVLVHTLAVLLLLAFLAKTTGRLWSSAFVAALFAIHPLRVESVAWIAERKDVLSGVFFFLTLLSYSWYVRAQSFGRYLVVAVTLACGLMSKAMLVTTPAILLLLDYWPLGRWQSGKSKEQSRSERDLIIEKLPLFGLCLASSIITFSLQVSSPESVGQLPLTWRLENALVSYVTYIGQLFWPVDLGVFYPHPDDRLAWWQVTGAAAFLITTTAVIFLLRKTRPYLFVGWFWYVIMLLPVIGIVEVGLQGHADRYTYLPHVGLYIGLVWLIADFLRAWRVRVEIIAGAGIIIVLALACCSWKQTSYWRNSDTLWRHTLAVTQNNDVALTNLGTFLMDRGQLSDALSYFERALAVRSSSEHRHYSLSLALIQDSIGNVLAREGRLDEAITHLRKAAELRPDYPDAHYNLGTALFKKGDLDGAIAEWRAALSIQPYDAGVHTNLGNALVQKGLIREAADHYQKALQSEPSSILPLNNLAWLMSAGPDDSIRNDAVALQLAKKANDLSNNDNAVFVRTLAAAYAQSGQFDQAIETARRASALARSHGEQDLVQELAQDVDLYQTRQPLRDPNLRNAQ